MLARSKTSFVSTLHSVLSSNSLPKYTINRKMVSSLPAIQSQIWLRLIISTCKKRRSRYSASCGEFCESSQELHHKLGYFFFFGANVSQNEEYLCKLEKCERQQQLIKRMSHESPEILHSEETQYNTVVLLSFFFPLYFSVLPGQLYRPHVNLYSVGTTGLLLLIYVSISVFIHYPLCLEGSQLQVVFRFSCERHDNCVHIYSHESDKL